MSRSEARREMKRVRELEQENARLKKIVADLTLDREMLQDVIKRKSEAWPEENAGRHDAIGMGDLDPPRLCGDPVTRRPTDTSRVDLVRPLWNSGSGKFARPACASGIGACTSCCDGRVGRSIRRELTESTGSWACSSGTRRRGGG